MTREDAETTFQIERRTADELAADARRDAVGPVASTEPAAFKTSDQLAADEVKVKVALATGSVTDEKSDASTKLDAPRRGRPPKPADTPTVNTPSKSAPSTEGGK